MVPSTIHHSIRGLALTSPPLVERVALEGEPLCNIPTILPKNTSDELFFEEQCSTWRLVLTLLVLIVALVIVQWIGPNATIVSIDRDVVLSQLVFPSVPSDTTVSTTAITPMNDNGIPPVPLPCITAHGELFTALGLLHPYVAHATKLPSHPYDWYITITKQDSTNPLMNIPVSSHIMRPASFLRSAYLEPPLADSNIRRGDVIRLASITTFEEAPDRVSKDYCQLNNALAATPSDTSTLVTVRTNVTLNHILLGVALNMMRQTQDKEAKITFPAAVHFAAVDTTLVFVDSYSYFTLQQSRHAFLQQGIPIVDTLTMVGGIGSDDKTLKPQTFDPNQPNAEGIALQRHVNDLSLNELAQVFALSNPVRLSGIHSRQLQGHEMSCQ